MRDQPPPQEPLQSTSGPRPQQQLPPATRLAEPGYWRTLLPELEFTSGRPYPPHLLNHAELITDPDSLRRDLSQHGYHIGRSGVPFVKELAAAAKSLTRQGLHPIWSLLSDEAWMLAKWFQPLFKAALPGFRLLADYYVFAVDPNNPEQRQGWRPHRDREDMPFRDTDHLPHYVTVWIALTDATPENGCIYLIPKPADPDYATLSPWKPPQDLQDILAVPVVAGTPIFWTGRIIHWGGRAAQLRSHSEIRLSIAFAAATEEFEQTTVEISGQHAMPSLEERIALIFSQIDNYQHNIPNFALYAQLQTEYQAGKK